jgi:hypothetical protein
MNFPKLYDSDQHALLCAVHAIRALVQYGCTPKEVLKAIGNFDLSKLPETTGDTNDYAETPKHRVPLEIAVSEGHHVLVTYASESEARGSLLMAARALILQFNVFPTDLALWLSEQPWTRAPTCAGPYFGGKN